MPRGSRLVLPNVPLHVIQRGNNRQACFHTLMDYRCYLKWLREYADETGCRIHAYVLMTNHIHLLLSARWEGAPSALMKALGQRYTQYFNRTHGRTGTLWEGRFRSYLVEAEDYLLNCQRYIELNPVRAGMVQHPVEYPWSSYRANVGLKKCLLVQPHEVFKRLGPTDYQRRSAYAELCSQELAPTFVTEFMQASGCNHVVGSAGFIADIEAACGRRVRPLNIGRPPGRR